MPKQRRKPRKPAQAPLPSVGHYVFAYRSPNGKLRVASMNETEALVGEAQAVWREAQNAVNPQNIPNPPVREPTAYRDAGETPATNVTSLIKSFEPPDIEAAIRRQPAFKEAPPSAAQIAEEREMEAHDSGAAAEPSAEPRLEGHPPDAERDTDTIPKMTDGDLGIVNAWAHQPAPKPVYVRETFHHVTVAKPSLARWMADAGVILRWGSVMLALAVVLVVAIDYGSAREVAPEPSVVTFNLQF